MRGIGHLSGDGIEGMGSHGLAIMSSPLAPTKCQREETKDEDQVKYQVKYKENRGKNR